jgi:enamine deaminase RidA (YjgF/YER057c/UK114 family)
MTFKPCDPPIKRLKETARKVSLMSYEARLAMLNLQLPPVAPPIANYVPAVIAGHLLIISGQLCFGLDGKLSPAHTGKVRDVVLPDAAKDAARLAGLNVIAQIRAAIGTLDRVKRIVRLGGMINSPPDFSALPPIMNGASDLMVELFGDAGRHARTTVGMASLPLDAAIEVEAMVEIV